MLVNYGQIHFNSRTTPATESTYVRVSSALHFVKIAIGQAAADLAGRGAHGVSLVATMQRLSRSLAPGHRLLDAAWYRCQRVRASNQVVADSHDEARSYLRCYMHNLKVSNSAFSKTDVVAALSQRVANSTLAVKMSFEMSLSPATDEEHELIVPLQQNIALKAA